MAYLSLSKRDLNVLEKIKDPESSPSVAPIIDPSLPKDPHVRDPTVYNIICQREFGIFRSIQQAELQLAGLQPEDEADPIKAYLWCLSRLSELISEHPDYASARNNRAQMLRRLYGDSMLLSKDVGYPQALLRNTSDSQRRDIARTALSDLDEAISLLSPPSPLSAVSPQVARTLASAHTQRGAIYHRTSRMLSKATLSVDPSRREATWTKLDFEESASRDFAFGGRYGNEVAKGLAVSTNPTAKLCGEMVREAMRKEYSPEFGS